MITDAAPKMGRCRTHFLRREFSLMTRQRHQSGAVAKKLRRAAFIDRNMAALPTKDGAVTGHQGREAKGVRRGTADHWKNTELAFEDLAKPRLKPGGNFVVAVGSLRARRRGFYRG